MGCNAVARAAASVLFKFQYPLRVEVGCNVDPNRTHIAHTGVSVPSTGRSGLQQRMAACSQALLPCFSTLYGSKWVATRRSLPISSRRSEFQYTSNRLGVVCAVQLPISSRRSEFQYPLRGSSPLMLRAAVVPSRRSEFQYPITYRCIRAYCQSSST